MCATKPKLRWNAEFGLYYLWPTQEWGETFCCSFKEHDAADTSRGQLGAHKRLQWRYSGVAAYSHMAEAKGFAWHAISAFRPDQSENPEAFSSTKSLKFTAADWSQRAGWPHPYPIKRNNTHGNKKESLRCLNTAGGWLIQPVDELKPKLRPQYSIQGKPCALQRRGPLGPMATGGWTDSNSYKIVFI